MSVTAKDTRTRMIEAAVEGLQRRGVSGMSFTEILASSGAARGAIYHHFPGGKNELVAEAARRNGADIRTRLMLLPTGTPSEVVAAFLAAVRPVVGASTTGGGCAVAAITVGAVAGDGSPSPNALRQVAAGAFTSWIDALTDRLTAAGSAPDVGRDLATTLVTLLEGAHILCRATGSLDPFDAVARAALVLAESAVA